MILDGHYTHASDVWAFGVLAWELYTTFTTEQDKGEFSVPFYDLGTDEVNLANTDCMKVNLNRRNNLNNL